MRSLTTLGRRIEQLVRARSARRQVIVAAGTRDLVDWPRVAALEAEGVQVVIITSGVPRKPDEAAGGMTEHEIGP
jgi:hypothetical protein